MSMDSINFLGEKVKYYKKYLQYSTPPPSPSRWFSSVQDSWTPLGASSLSDAELKNKANSWSFTGYEFIII